MSTAGVIDDVHDDEKDSLRVTFSSVTAFGEVSMAEFSPQAGWTFPYNINPQLVTSTTLSSGSVTHSGSFAVIESGTANDGVAFIRSNAVLAYTPGIGAKVAFTAVFTEGVPDSQQLIGIGNAEDGWFFGFDGDKFGIMNRRDAVDTWYYQEDWIEDKRSDLDLTKGNVFQIKYQWLGFGMQYFYIENENGDLSLVHKIPYSNKNINTSVSNPTLPLSAGVANTGNTTNIVLKTPSAVGGLEGNDNQTPFEAVVSYEQSNSISAGVETYLFSIQNPADYLGKDNRLYAKLNAASIASDGTKAVKFRVYFQGTLTSPVWNDLEPGISPLQYDFSGTWTPGSGSKVYSVVLAKVDSRSIDLTPLKAVLFNRQNMIVTAESSNASDVDVSITFRSRG